jgi:hypothetical protein
VSLDIVFRAAGDALRHSVEIAVGEVLDAAAAAADEMMVVRGVAEAIAQGAVFEPDAAEEVEVDEELHRAKDGRSAGSRDAALDVGDAEEIVAGKRGFDDGATAPG